MIVADASLIVAFLLPGPDNALAEQVREKDGFWIAPPRWQVEFVSAIWKKLKVGQIDLRTAGELFGHLEEVVAQSLWVDPREVLETAIAVNHSPYDCEYVVLARTVGIRLVTFDQPLRERFPDVAFAPGRFIHDTTDPA